MLTKHSSAPPRSCPQCLKQLAMNNLVHIFWIQCICNSIYPMNSWHIVCRYFQCRKHAMRRIINVVTLTAHVRHKLKIQNGRNTNVGNNVHSSSAPMVFYDQNLCQAKQKNKAPFQNTTPCDCVLWSTDDRLFDECKLLLHAQHRGCKLCPGLFISSSCRS